MKSKVVAITLLASTAIIGHSNTAFAEVCYDVGGSVTTENVTPTLQIGNITMTLSIGGNTAFDETGSLVGNITGTTGDPYTPTTLLSHTARFPQGNSFVTNNDEANLAFLPDYNFNPVRRAVDGVACSFWIHESIADIVRGTKFFKNVSTDDDWEVFADGYISNCPDENENSFVLSGKLCTE